MNIVHFGHSCVLLETGQARLLIDPGSFSHGFESLHRLDAVLLTHQHGDHVDFERLPPLLAANPQAEVIAETQTAAAVTEHGLHCRVTEPGERLELGGSSVEVLGGEHAVIHPDLPAVANVGFFVDEFFFHPGDSFVVPDRAVPVLGLPVAAPWLKLAEAVDYLRDISPRVAVPIHEAVSAIPETLHGMLARLAPGQTAVHVLRKGEYVALR